MLKRFLRQDHLVVDKTDEVRKLLGWIRGERKERPIVVDGKHPFGIPNKMALMGSRFHERAHIIKFTRPTPVPREDASLYDAMDAISESLAPYVPVQKENGTLAGYIHALDLMEEVTEGPLAREMMQSVPVLHPDAKLAEAGHAFRNTHADGLPVLDDRGQVVGVLSRRSIVDVEVGRRAHNPGAGDRAADTTHYLREKVSDRMEVGPIEVGPDASFDDVRELLHQNEHAFVMDRRDGRAEVLGVILPEHLVRAVHPHSDPPRAGSRHGAGVATKRGVGR